MIPGGAHALMLGGDPCEVYQIGHSLRFNAADTPYLSRTLGAGDTTTWTLSAWLKRTTLGSVQDVFLSDNLTTHGSNVVFNATDNLEVYLYSSAYVWRAVTSRTFRDVSAHFHLLVVLDTNNAVAADRLRIYVNGIRETSFSVSPAISIGQTGYINGSTYPHYFSSTRNKLNAYLSDPHFVGGQALAASYFGFICPSTGQWRPKAYTGTYGTNGFHLDFGDGSAATAAALGADRSGNGNNWTPTNISVTAGAGCDWLEDTPTNNFATLNPLDVSSGGTLSNGNLELITAGVSAIPRVSTVAVQSGKYYVEATAIGYDGNTGSENTMAVGIVRPADLPTGFVSKGVNYSSGAGTAAGIKTIDGASTAYGAYWATEGVSYVVGVALDLDAGTIDFSLNGVWQGSFSIPSSSSGWCFGAAWLSTVGYGSVKWNFGQRAFAYAPPAGFKAVCAKNFPVPSIKRPSEHMTVKLDTGANIKATAEAVYPGFLEWIKDRANANNHQLLDSVRGAAAVLQPNTAAAEAAYAAPVGSSVAWLWRAGGATVANADGSIASQVSANPAAGFSVVSHTGSGANATIGHGLGVAPKLIIVKDLAVGNWAVLHGDLANTEYLLLNSVAAKATGATYWNSASPSSSVFSVGTASDVNVIGHNYVAYCFSEVPEYSRFGKYTGNGSADGPFVHCGFRPAFVIAKRVDITSNWISLDSLRDAGNLTDAALYPNLTNAEEINASVAIDLLSTGFKVRHTAAPYNVSGGTYVFLAFAEFPFKYANAR